MKAYLFAGQGAQYVGMGQDLYNDHSVAKDLIHHADEILGYGLSEIMFEGDEERLKRTQFTQPALYVHAMTQLAVAGMDEQVDYMAGHSLGECTALAASGAISFADGLRLVQVRAEAMQKACEATPGTMAAIVGMDNEQVESVCKEIEDVVVPANYNSPGQLVISGSQSGITKAVERLKELGAKRAIELVVAGAFHSPLMSSASDELKTVLDTIEFKAPRCPIVQNVPAQGVSDPSELKQNILSQLTAPVRWTECVQSMISSGVSDFVEVGGNGRVLTGLMRRIDRSVQIGAIVTTA